MEFVRSLLGKQERWRIWRIFSVEPEEKEKCHLSHSTLHRWLDGEDAFPTNDPRPSTQRRSRQHKMEQRQTLKIVA